MSIFDRSDPTRRELIDLHAEYLNLLSAANERVSRMNAYRAENNGVRSPASEQHFRDNDDYGRKSRNRVDEPTRQHIALPLGKALTVKHAYRIAGQLPDVFCDQRDETPQERYRSDTIEKVVWAIIRASGGETTFTDAAWDGSELGSSCFDVYFDVDKQMPLVRAIDPTGIVEVQGVDDPHDFQRVYRTWDAPLAAVQAMYRDLSFRGQPVRVDEIAPYRKDGDGEWVRIISLCDKGRAIRFAAGDKAEQVVGLYEVEHNYGFVPYVVIPNIGPYRDVWGWADYEFVRHLVAYLPALFSREADVLRSVANGGVIESGTGANPHTVAKVAREGGVLPSKRDGKVEPIQPPDMPQFHETHSERAMDFYKMLGFAPDAAWGLPGSGSGTDRGLQLQPLLEYTAMKQKNWMAGLSRLYGMALQMVEQKTVTSVRYRGSRPSGKLSGPGHAFTLLLGPDEAALEQEIDGGSGFPQTIEYPRTPKDLLDGDYYVRFAWRNRVDPDDPSYVMSELNKFGQGAQSLETTLENLGVQAPEDEMRRIEKESERFPWVNQGLVSLLMAQFRGNAQGTGGGAPADSQGALSGAMETMSGLGGGGQSGALDADAGASALGPSSVGDPYGGA